MTTNGRRCHLYQVRFCHAMALLMGVLILAGCKNQQTAPTTQPDIPPVSDAEMSVAPISNAITLLQEALISLRNEATQLQIVGRELSTQEHSELDAVADFQQLVERVTLNLEEAAANMGVATVSASSSPPPDHKVSGALRDARELTRQAIDELQQGSSSIQVVGRTLTQKEMELASQMDTAALQLEVGLTNLNEGAPANDDVKLLAPGQEP